MELPADFLSLGRGSVSMGTDVIEVVQVILVIVVVFSKNPLRHLKWERNEKKIEKDKGGSNKNSMESSCYHCGTKDIGRVSVVCQNILLSSIRSH